MKSDLKNKILPYAIIISIFFSISTIYFWLGTQGLGLKQGDTSTFVSVSKEIRDFRKIYNEESYWTNSIFGGMPSYQITNNYSTGYRYIISFFGFIMFRPAYLIFIAMLSFFILAKQFRIDNWLSTLGAIAYGLMSYNILIIEAGHNTKMLALAFVPAVIGSFVMVYRSKSYVLPSIIFAFFMGFELFANHIQVTYYFSILMVILGGVFFSEYYKEKNLKEFFKRSGFIIIAGILAIGSNFSNYYFTYEYSKDTIRNKSELSINSSGQKDKFKTDGLNRDYIVQWSYGKEETVNLLVPNAKGDSGNLTGEFFKYLSKKKPKIYNYVVENYQKNNGKIFGGYWGNQPFTSGANYLGSIIFILGLLYFFLIKTRMKWGLLFATILAILLSWGKNLGGSIDGMWLTNFFIDYIPLYNKFRTVSMFLVVVNMIFPLAALLFLSKLINNREWATKHLKKIYIISGSIIGLLLMLYIFPSILNFTSVVENSIFNNLNIDFTKGISAINPEEVKDILIDFRINVFRSDIIRSLGFIMACLFILYLLIKEKLSRNIGISLIIVLVFIDMWQIDKRYLNNDRNPNKKSEYVSWIKNKLNNKINAGPADKKIYQLEAKLNSNIAIEAENIIQKIRMNKRRVDKMDLESAQFAALNFNSNYRVLNLDNPFNSAEIAYFHKSSGGYHAAKLRRYQDVIDFYILKELQQLQNPEKLKILSMLNTKYFVYQNSTEVFENKGAFGNAWFVGNIKLVQNADESIESLGTVNLKETAVVESKYAKELPTLFEGNGQISLSSYKPNKLVYNSNSISDELAVFSEVYYEKGWNAYIDGVKVNHLRANYLLRALKVPRGNHTIEFKFEPKMYNITSIINIVCFLLIIIGFVFFTYKKYEKISI